LLTFDFEDELTAEIDEEVDDLLDRLGLGVVWTESPFSCATFLLRGVDEADEAARACV
jgi:hypothetical protein